MSLLIALLQAYGAAGPAEDEPSGPVPATVILSSVTGGSGQVEIAWTRPTTKFDGSPLPSGDISHYLVRRYSTAGVLQAPGAINVGNVLSYNHTSVPADTWEYTVACVSVYGEGGESARLQATVT